MTRYPFVTLALALTLAAVTACGGPSNGSTTPAVTGEEVAAADALPFDQERVREALAAIPAAETCGNPDDDGTLGALFEEQRGYLGDAQDLDVTFECGRDEPGPWSCQWSVFTRPSGAPDPDDPCAGEGEGSGFFIMVQVDDAGTIVPDSIGCIAPG